MTSIMQGHHCHMTPPRPNCCTMTRLRRLRGPIRPLYLAVGSRHEPPPTTIQPKTFISRKRSARTHALPSSQ